MTKRTPEELEAIVAEQARLIDDLLRRSGIWMRRAREAEERVASLVALERWPGR